jgi:hypothetical protein
MLLDEECSQIINMVKTVKLICKEEKTNYKSADVEMMLKDVRSRPSNELDTVRLSNLGQDNC